MSGADWRWETAVEEWSIILSDWVDASRISANKKYMAGRNSLPS